MYGHSKRRKPTKEALKYSHIILRSRGNYSEGNIILSSRLLSFTIALDREVNVITFGLVWNHIYKEIDILISDTDV